MEFSKKEPILYVDDEPENLQGFHYLLYREFKVFTASTAKEGFEVLKNNEIKVLLTDQRMPETSGIEFLEQVFFQYPNVIRIIITAYSDNETILQAINQGKVYHFLTKPWNNNELRIVINRAIETYNLRQDKIELIKNLQHTNHELFEAKEKAEESDRLKSSFLANMSHEIRTPLNAIVGFSNLILDHNIESEMKKQFANIIENSSADLLRIVEDILDTSRIESGIYNLNNTLVDIHKFMCDLLLVYSNNPQLKEKNIALKYLYPEAADKITLLIDELKLKQILSNILNNAIKFTDNGELEISYNLINSEHLKFIQFVIRDTGIGIPSDKFDFIFERFRKLETSEDKLYRGNGLGLFIAQKLANILGGNVYLQSEVEKGSTFFVKIPINQEFSVSNFEKNYNHNFSNLTWLGKRLLIVEDESSNFKYIEALLKNKLEIIWATNGKDAIKICEENSIDLVLMDIKLPIMDGLEATKQIKLIRPALPIIAVTAYAMASDKIKSLEAGCDNYISKPYKIEELFSLIETYINRN